MAEKAVFDPWRVINMKTLFATITMISLAGAALAASQVIDGENIDPTTWGVPSIAVQDTNTQFANNYNELNQLFVDSDNDMVYMGIPGNLADNNALTVFIDINPATGSHPLATEPGAGVPCVGEYPRILRYFEGATLSDPNLPAVFTPDYALTVSVGSFPGQSTSQLVYACDLTDLSTFDVTVLGIGAADSGNGLLTGSSGVQIALNDSNTGGVGEWFTPGGETPAQTGDDPTDADTGIEIAIPRALIGLNVATPTEVSIFAYITNNAQSDEGIPGICGRAAYGSNQALPGLAGWGNMAAFNGDTVILDISTNPGQNFVATIIPGTP